MKISATLNVVNIVGVRQAGLSISETADLWDFHTRTTISRTVRWLIMKVDCS